MDVPWAPGRLPLLGHVVAYTRDPLALLLQASRLGRLVRLDFPWMQSMMVNDPDLIEQILVTDHRSFIKDRFLQDLKRVLGDGLLTSEGDFWLRQRRLAQPAFHKDRVAGYARTMVDCATREVSRWRDGEERDVHEDMMRVTLEIVGKTLFGADVTDRAREVAEGLEAVMARYVDPVATGVPHWDKLPTPLNRRFHQGVQRLDRLVRDLIAEHRAGRQGDPGDLLSMYLAARDEDGTGMSDQQLRDEVLTLVLAGHETTAIALSWTWMLLSQHPHVAEKLHAELDAVLGGRAPTAADLPRLPYADRVIKESMRLYPPAWAIGREAARDVELAGVPIPKGTQLWIVQWALHRDGRWFEEPDRFDPDRWAGDLQRRIPKYAYFPFGGGPRMCIGHAFATMEAVLLLATFAQRFRMDLVAGHPLKPLPAITLRPKHGVRVRLVRRASLRPPEVRAP
ncbi:MAG: cytochrome P450 [Deltaproteobacteria bacterium]|nr:cytochrome P450 [Deltaproteobacteria bacterium]